MRQGSLRPSVVGREDEAVEADQVILDRDDLLSQTVFDVAAGPDRAGDTGGANEALPEIRRADSADGNVRVEQKQDA